MMEGRATRTKNQSKTTAGLRVRANKGNQRRRDQCQGVLSLSLSLRTVASRRDAPFPDLSLLDACCLLLPARQEIQASARQQRQVPRRRVKWVCEENPDHSVGGTRKKLSVQRTDDGPSERNTRFA